MVELLVLYWSERGATARLAEALADGVASVEGCVARVRTVAPVGALTSPRVEAVPQQGPPYATLQDLRECAGLALGSPTRFGGMAAPLKHFLEQTTALWFAGSLAGKPACVFTTTATQHGGQESTLISMMLPLLHHGMLLLGIPYTEPLLSTTTGGGTPYGASHVSGTEHQQTISRDEAALARALGRRLAQTALRLASR